MLLPPAERSACVCVKATLQRGPLRPAASPASLVTAPDLRVPQRALPALRFGANSPGSSSFDFCPIAGLLSARRQRFVLPAVRQGLVQRPHQRHRLHPGDCKPLVAAHFLITRLCVCVGVRVVQCPAGKLAGAQASITCLPCGSVRLCFFPRSSFVACLIHAGSCWLSSRCGCVV